MSRKSVQRYCAKDTCVKSKA
ncbi:hypothetical protein RHECNPAF_1340024 [Rhizobium etli CNPAF512]|nr:hypothetical protein RHECNPAF_1340024 [Rhizobium etli CNPAF512]